MEIRPRIFLEFDETPEVVMHRVRSCLDQCPHCVGMSVGRHAEIYIVEEERRVYSPCLSISAEEQGAGARVVGRFGPHPALWTWYMFCAFAMVLTALLGLVLGYAQWSLELKPWAIWLVPVSCAGLLLLYLVSLIGQRLAGDQIEHLANALDLMVDIPPDLR